MTTSVDKRVWSRAVRSRQSNGFLVGRPRRSRDDGGGSTGTIARQLEDAFGVKEASILMDRPPGGWSDLVTNQVLDLKIDALRADLRTEMSALRTDLAKLDASVDRRLRAQTWMMMTTMIAAVGLSVTLSRI
jgi:hypothetical protein